jgi:hypothetical protein
MVAGEEALNLQPPLDEHHLVPAFARSPALVDFFRDLSQ